MVPRCDKSQKLFQAGTKSAVVIAGFAVGRARTGSPLDLSLAALLRNRFGTRGSPGPRGKVENAAEWVRYKLEQDLTGIAALFDASYPSGNLYLCATFAGFNADGVPIIKQLLFKESWVPAGPAAIIAPRYDVESGEVTVNKFQAVTAGITCVANAILGGHYRTTDPVIKAYYRKRRQGGLDNASVPEIASLARVILRETGKFTDAVGGREQIAILPVEGKPTWVLQDLPTDTELGARFELSKGVSCSGGHPCTRGEPGYFEDFTHPVNEAIPNFYLASVFNGATVALDDNYFVRNIFQNVRLKWQGRQFPYLFGNTFRAPCVLELPENSDLPNDPQTADLLNNCRVERKLEVAIDPGTVGIAGKWEAIGHPCVAQNPGGGANVEDTTGYPCRNDASARCSDCDSHMCDSHAEICESCGEVFCSTCLAYHTSAYHQKKPAAEYRRLRKSA